MPQIIINTRDDGFVNPSLIATVTILKVKIYQKLTEYTTYILSVKKIQHYNILSKGKSTNKIKEQRNQLLFIAVYSYPTMKSRTLSSESMYIYLECIYSTNLMNSWLLYKIQLLLYEFNYCCHVALCVGEHIMRIEA